DGPGPGDLHGHVPVEHPVPGPAGRTPAPGRPARCHGTRGPARAESDRLLRHADRTSLLAGWVADPTATTAPIAVDVYVDDAFQSRTVANVSRQDVNDYLNNLYHTNIYNSTY